jgi:hypothetical protein
MNDKRAVGGVGPHDYLRGYRDGVRGIVEHLLGKADIGRRLPARSSSTTAAAASTSSDEEGQGLFVPPTEVAVAVEGAYLSRIGEVTSRLTAAGLEVENVDSTTRTVVGLIPRRGLLKRIDKMKRLEGVEDVEEMLCLAVIVDDAHRSLPGLEDVVAGVKAAGLRSTSAKAALGIIRGTARPGSLRMIRAVEGVESVETITC